MFPVCRLVTIRAFLKNCSFSESKCVFLWHIPYTQTYHIPTRGSLGGLFQNPSSCSATEWFCLWQNPPVPSTDWRTACEASTTLHLSPYLTLLSGENLEGQAVTGNIGWEYPLRKMWGKWKEDCERCSNVIPPHTALPRWCTRLLTAFAWPGPVWLTIKERR